MGRSLFPANAQIKKIPKRPAAIPHDKGNDSDSLLRLDGDPQPLNRTVRGGFRARLKQAPGAMAAAPMSGRRHKDTKSLTIPAGQG